MSSRREGGERCLTCGKLEQSSHRQISPHGERACIRRDGGKVWDVKHEIVLSEAPNADLGYPASAQLDDGTIVTVYYQVEKDGEKPCLMSTRWRIEEAK